MFGDGTVILKSTPGHTPGHQSLFVQLPRTRRVVLSGDLYHFPAERTLKKIPNNETTSDRRQASREAIEEFMQETGAPAVDSARHHRLCEAEALAGVLRLTPFGCRSWRRGAT